MYVSIRDDRVGRQGLITFSQSQIDQPFYNINK